MLAEMKNNNKLLLRLRTTFLEQSNQIKSITIPKGKNSGQTWKRKSEISDQPWKLILLGLPIILFITTLGRNLSDLQGNSNSEQEVNFRITISVINVILSFTAVLGNSANLITIWKTSSLRSVTKILLGSLAVSDPFC